MYAHIAGVELPGFSNQNGAGKFIAIGTAAHAAASFIKKASHPGNTAKQG